MRTNHLIFRLKPYIISYLLSLAMLMMSTTSKSQSIIIGQITDTEALPLIGVSIQEKNATAATISDIDGRYTLKVTSNESVLVFNYVGYAPQEITIGQKTELDVVMTQDAKILEDIIVVGYRRENRADLSTAISSIKSRDVEKLVVSGIEQALQGQAPGISVTQVTGAPGDDMAVRIRGAGTLGNNNPLFIIDGVPTSGNINMFSVNDILSIEVLKDGASAAIYGSRASNGVVLITTKRGKSGKPVFSFNASNGIQTPIKLPELLNSRDYLMYGETEIYIQNI